MTWKPGDLTYEISVCQCCMLTHANGECCDPLYWEGGVDHDGHEPLSLLDATFDGLALGGTHPEECASLPNAVDCECDRLSFSWSSCGGCGSPLGGDRYKMTVFPNERLP